MEMRMKKVQILMSTYNGQTYLKKQIESILAQTYPNIELIIRDDGSKEPPAFISVIEWQRIPAEYLKNKKQKRKGCQGEQL